MTKKIRIKESELVNLIRRTIKESQLLNEAALCWTDDDCPGGHCNRDGGNLGQDSDGNSTGRCKSGPASTTIGGGKRGTKSSSGSKGNDRSRIGAREVGEGQDYHGSHAGGDGAASSRTALSEAPGCPSAADGGCPDGMYCDFSGYNNPGTCIEGDGPNPFDWGGKTKGGGGTNKKLEVREIRRNDMDMARRKPYSAKARDMRGGRVNY